METVQKSVYILGGGTFSHVRSHLALSAPAFGNTARQLYGMCLSKFTYMDVKLILTKMADPTNSEIVTNDDIETIINQIINDNTTKVIFFNVAMCDFNGSIEDYTFGQIHNTPSGKYATRLRTTDGTVHMELTPTEKIITKIRKKRKDIFLVGFKTTSNDSLEDQYFSGLNLLKKSSCNLVLANDIVTRQNMIITPEEAKYSVTENRNDALKELVDIAYLRSHLSFTRSTVVDGKPVDWNSDKVYPALRTIVNYCIEKGAYKPFNGATVGHFACKLDDTTFLTSIRKTNFNDIEKNGLVMVKTDGPDSVIAYGAKPSVGGQSQRLIFSNNKQFDCIVHFHCPIKINSKVPIVSQREFECGSHECGQNTSNGLKLFNDGKIACVMLDHHGPNIVFNHNIDPAEVIKFIDENFSLEYKTHGFSKVELNIDQRANLGVY